MKKVAAINDLSGAGRCSLMAAIPVLSVMGLQVYPLPTAVFSNQTGYPEFYMEDFTPHMGHFTRMWEKLGFSFDGIYTGFLAEVSQVEEIERFLEVFCKKDTFLLVDPIMGDDGARYPNFDDDLCDAIGRLTKKATLLTPNLTECCFLTGADYEALVAKKHSPQYLEDIAALGQQLLSETTKQVVITGIRYQATGETEEWFYNLLLEGDQWSVVKTTAHGGSFSGTGDLLASVLCGGILRGMSLLDAVSLATELITSSIADTIKAPYDRNDGIVFEPHLSLLLPKE